MQDKLELLFKGSWVVILEGSMGRQRGLLRNRRTLSCHLVIRKLSHPYLPWNPGNPNDSRCNSSNSGAGVLVAVTGHGPTPPEGGTYYH
ncbi:hypothetical protein AVEN_34567-1 [Araneus ventricosus]|uniref:Uncharacterized protein n=1 Tax=Araneus ventricosus TaxID=182803 RepID=A0A4Y2B262_ARAVE|nr:hypothetical protein AVEN_34567-1 [Araneus ventricosus]